MQPDFILAEEPEPFGIESLLDLARRIKSLGGVELGTSKRTMFFSHALCAYYGGTYSWLEKEAGDVLYHISGLLSEEERKRVRLHPKKTAQAIMDYEGGLYGFTAWHNLDEWRADWKISYPVILELSLLLTPDQEASLQGF
jgi:hypothetical protein